MAYDEKLAARVEELIGDRADVTRVRMFGGLAWLVNGNMAVAVRGKGGLLVRVDPAEDVEGAAPMIMRGRPMAGWVTVTAEDCGTPEQLAGWVRRGMAYALTLPAK